MNEEKYKYISEKLGEISDEATEEVLRLADETGEDRDKLMCAFADVMHCVVHASTFSEYKLK